MPSLIGKRKRELLSAGTTPAKKIAISHSTKGGGKRATSNSRPSGPSNGTKSIPLSNTAEHRQARKATDPFSVQIITGSYERVLHGITATCTVPAARIEPDDQGPSENDTTNGREPVAEDVTFSDTFLFAAHTASIRCLALSPPTGSDKRYLASGGSDERINLYSISTTPPARNSRPTLASLAGTYVAENARNHDIGSLIHHDRAITRMHFPSKGKLFSAAEDNTIAISRTRDWTMLSSIKAPIPKPQGRPSGDTAAPGEVPAGVNDFAIHPSNKLMLSVGRGERCMRLWNLTTGKKAGVLSFDRSLLQQVGEGKYSSGEGRSVLWDEAGESYAVGFERGAAVFGIDSKPRAVLRPQPLTKLHEMHYMPSSAAQNVLAVSTEDGRVLFFDNSTLAANESAASLPNCKCIAQLGGVAAGVSGRIKDFEILQLPSVGEKTQPLIIVTGSSDGAIHLWLVRPAELSTDIEAVAEAEAEAAKELDFQAHVKQIGTLVGTHETGNRITCVTAFVMDVTPEFEIPMNGRVEHEADGAGGEDAESNDDDE